MGDQSNGGGPLGLGDPNDNSLSRVEIELLIPRLMRYIAKVEKCPQELNQYKQCCKENSRTILIMCQEQYVKLKECLTKWYQDEGFKERCKKLYLKERSEYRRTGAPVVEQEDAV